jgi:hypothetical protein
MHATRVSYNASRTFTRVFHGHSIGNYSLLQFIHSFILVCLTKGPRPLSQWVFHSVRSGVPSLNFKYPPFSLRTSSSYLHLLPIISTLPSIFPSQMCFKRQFLRKMWQIQILFLLFTVRSMFLSYVILHFSHNRSNWSFRSSSSTTFQNSPGISDLLSEVSKFQHIYLYSKYSSLLVSSLNLSLICLHLAKCCFCRGNPYWK